MKRLNRLERQDEKPFEAVAALSEFNQRAYELFAQPFVQALGNEATAKLSRQFHPLRFQRWAFSDQNPWLAWLKPAAAMVQAGRQALAALVDGEGEKVHRQRRPTEKKLVGCGAFGRPAEHHFDNGLALEAVMCQIARLGHTVSQYIFYDSES